MNIWNWCSDGVRGLARNNNSNINKEYRPLALRERKRSVAEMRFRTGDSCAPANERAKNKKKGREILRETNNKLRGSLYVRACPDEPSALDSLSSIIIIIIRRGKYIFVFVFSPFFLPPTERWVRFICSFLDVHNTRSSLTRVYSTPRDSHSPICCRSPIPPRSLFGLPARSGMR